MKKPGGGAVGMAEDAEKIPGRPVFCVGGQEELKTRGGSLSSEGTNAAVQAERSTLIKVLRSLVYINAIILDAIAAIILSSEFIFMVNATNAVYNLLAPAHKRTKGRAPVRGSEFTSKDAALQGGWEKLLLG
jgi:hypothetical protein